MSWRSSALGIVASTAFISSVAFASPNEPRDSFDYATAKIGKWELSATTEVNWPDYGSELTVKNINCHGENGEITFDVDRSGGLRLSVRFLGFADKNGNRDEITLLGDRLWLYIDGERWEFANIPARGSRFSNVEYPPPSSDDILPIWTGFQGVRKIETDPWRKFDSVIERMISARTVQWSFKSRDWKVVDSKGPGNRLPRDWNRTRYPVDNARLAEAVNWCARQVSSDAAYILPANLKETANP